MMHKQQVSMLFVIFVVMLVFLASNLLFCNYNEKFTFDQFKTANITKGEALYIKDVIKKELTHKELSKSTKNMKHIGILVSRIGDIYIISFKMNRNSGKMKRVSRAWRGYFDEFAKDIVPQALNEALVGA